MQKRTMAAALLLASAITLTGCSVGYEAPAAGGQRTTSSPQPSSGTEQEPATSPSATASDGDGRGAEGGATVESAIRSRYSGTANTVTCPGGELMITQPAAVAKVDGACKRVKITAAGTVVLLGDVDELIVSGTATTVVVRSAKRIEVAPTSSGSVVEWESGSPEVVDNGVVSVVRPAGESE